MDTLLVFALFFAALLLSLWQGVSLLYPLCFGLFCFMLLARRRGTAFTAQYPMLLGGAKKSLIVLQIFVFIGAITAIWRACGTIAYIVYYGIQLIHAHYFLLFAFILTVAVSFLLGTSFGTVGTMGVVLMILAKSGQADIAMTAGAIIGGAYFGDRCSPMSSSANLVAVLTRTSLYVNLRNMFHTAWLPFALSCLAYTLLSQLHPLQIEAAPLLAEIDSLFVLQPVVLLPALIILAAALAKWPVKRSMGFSIIAGSLIAVWVQHQTPAAVLQTMVYGFQPTQSGFFAGIIGGGGLLSMLQVSLIVCLSSAYAGLFAGTGLLQDVESACTALLNKIGVMATALLTGAATAAFGCNQTLAVILSHQFLAAGYAQRNLSAYRLACDLENTVILLSALIPWNIAGAVPAAMLGADAGFIPYAFYLYFVPLSALVLRYRLAEPPVTR